MICRHILPDGTPPNLSRMLSTLLLFSNTILRVGQQVETSLSRETFGQIAQRLQSKSLSGYVSPIALPNLNMRLLISHPMKRMSLSYVMLRVTFRVLVKPRDQFSWISHLDRLLRTNASRLLGWLCASYWPSSSGQPVLPT
jgi:hypothetical protein